jgi:Replicative DNA helicase
MALGAEIFNDEAVLPEILAQCIWDRHWLRQVGDIVTQEDFKPLTKGQSSLAWVLGGMALEFHRQHRVPIASLIGQEVHKWLKDSGASQERTQEVLKYLKRIKASYDPARTKVLAEKVTDFKKTNQRQKAIQELIDLEQTGELTEEKWLSIMRGALEGVNRDEGHNYLDELETREVRRRSGTTYRKRPLLGIDELDWQIQGIGRGELGLWLGYYKMGKSTALIHTAKWCMWQGLNVLYFTLEDPIDAVEDRLDADITHTLIEELATDDQMSDRFRRFKNTIRSRMRIIDGTEGGISVGQLESMWERQRIKQFDADVVIVDYDDEIRPVIKRLERRQEFADIYRDLRKFASRKNIILWTAAQTNRGSEGKERLSGKDVAEDISKVRKVTLALGIGVGEWGPGSRYIQVMGHKFDSMNVGCNIWTDLKHGSFYDQEQTLAWMAKERRNGNGHG